MVVVPGVEGDLGILPGHMPLMTQIKPGELCISMGDEEILIAVGEGFLEVLPERISVMTEMAIKEADIDLQAAEEAVARAEKELLEKTLSGEELARVMSSLLRSLAKVNVKRRAHR
jgi:F-type H+-transporting ATPase subunit epsilon